MLGTTHKKNIWLDQNWSKSEPAWKGLIIYFEPWNLSNFADLITDFAWFSNDNSLDH